MRRIATIGTILCASVLASNADLAEQKKRWEQELRTVPVPELPARAAEIVRSTPAAERSQAAIIAVEAISSRHPAAAPTVVAAISKAAPETAAAVSAAASRKDDKGKPESDPTRPDKSRKDDSKIDSEKGRGGNQGNGNGHGNGNGNGNGNRPDRPEHQGRPDKSDLLPNGKPRPFPHHGHTDDPNHVHHPVKYNRPKHH
ncbi:MAG TPA: hypothetical protein VM735_12630 [Candidatus Kapabacteria bacterium]|nr:hypothetical protein [Candidatus Kapabacteria bacterium]